MACYGKLRADASSLTTAEIHRICTPLYYRTSTSSMWYLWAHKAAKIMILCNFRPGGMIRCLVGVYTSDFLKFASIDACLLTLSNIPDDPEEPPNDLPAMQHLFHQHIPFKVSFQSARRDMLSGTATIIIVPPNPTSPLFTINWPPISRNPTSSCFPSGHSNLSA